MAMMKGAIGLAQCSRSADPVVVAWSPGTVANE